MAREVKKVGFIGLGDIGLPMAKRVVCGGYETTVCGHRRREPIEAMKSLGAKEAANPKVVAKASDVTIIMVQNDKQAEEVIFGPSGLLEGVKEGDGILLMGTFAPAFCKSVGEAARPRKVDVLDAPVVGARMGAEAGTLGISVGGDKDALEDYRAVLQTMGRITYCGELGMGQIVKLVNNMNATAHAWMLYESINWGIRNGASEKLLIEHIKIGSGNSFTAQNWEWIKSMFTAPPPPTYYVGAKDLGHAVAIGLELRQPTPITALLCESCKGPPPKLLKGPDDAKQ